VVPTGPWPPYSFVPQLDRSPSGRVVVPPGVDAADRRVS
jgi:hypothetical protein